MLCPSCHARTSVLESRPSGGGLAVRRRRACSRCGRRLTTYERFEPGPLEVRKRDGSRQRFDRGKLRSSLLGAAHKRPVDAGHVERIVERVQAEAEAAGGELSAERIGELCLAGLRELDAGAYLQYAGTLAELKPEFAAGWTQAGGADSVRGDGDRSALPAEATAKGRET